ncbi:MAG: PmbA/TldA family metallopeptidase, partial [Burkholderiales bacterium]
MDNLREARTLSAAALWDAPQPLESRSLEGLFERAREGLLAPYGLDTPDLQQVLGHIMGHRVDFADLYFQYTRAESWSLEEGQVKSGSFSIDQGVGVRAVAGEKTASAYSDEISASALLQAATATRAIARLGQTGAVQAVTSRDQHRLYLPADPLASMPDEEKVHLLEKLERLTRAVDARITHVMAGLAGEYEIMLVARSDGLLTADVRPLVRLSLQVIAECNGRREQGQAGG